MDNFSIGNYYSSFNLSRRDVAYNIPTSFRHSTTQSDIAIFLINVITTSVPIENVPTYPLSMKIMSALLQRFFCLNMSGYWLVNYFYCLQTNLIHTYFFLGKLTQPKKIDIVNFDFA